MITTGYFARAKQNGLKSMYTFVHFVDDKNGPICGYKPHESLQYMKCSSFIHMPYIECKKCKEIEINKRKQLKIS